MLGKEDQGQSYKRPKNWPNIKKNKIQIFIKIQKAEWFRRPFKNKEQWYLFSHLNSPIIVKLRKYGQKFGV